MQAGFAHHHILLKFFIRGQASLARYICCYRKNQRIYGQQRGTSHTTAPFPRNSLFSSKTSFCSSSRKIFTWSHQSPSRAGTLGGEGSSHSQHLWLCNTHARLCSVCSRGQRGAVQGARVTLPVARPRHGEGCGIRLAGG